jgi:hypothetical protein
MNRFSREKEKPKPRYAPARKQEPPLSIKQYRESLRTYIDVVGGAIPADKPIERKEVATPPETLPTGHPRTCACERCFEYMMNWRGFDLKNL